MFPLFAKGKTNERPLIAPALRGAFRFSMQNASLYFAAGDLIFISDANGARVEFLGKATSALSSEVRCLYGLSYSRAAGAICWKPANAFCWKAPRLLPSAEREETGVIARRSVGGVLFLTKIKEATRSLSLTISAVRKNDASAFSHWVRDILRGGIEPFAFCEEYAPVRKAALISSRIAQKENFPEQIAVEIELEILAAGDYA
ncbi:MAG TPA: hypothetical protein PKW18_00870 [Candidatus Sumerlaeota bacterium]|nr:MAG: hypothetical protein BWY12_00088 [candidate division BRC1 bacterium ADurb.Bin183]HOE62385.1 hypothetical protein [Candidatus Sumerlaeota bacterium]HRR29951.1 hypothetical protein [Candidatus Sumerlaeia bacterium]HON49300.1 hypothetical protein [Candidatus Sumerlaeota bacterium]HOR64093.1 hypothetical protein [Candidatus Sumerlaeota bacterium]